MPRQTAVKLPPGGRERGGSQRTLLDPTSSLVTEAVVTARAPSLEDRAWGAGQLSGVIALP